MNKLILLSIVLGGYIFAGIQGESVNSGNLSSVDAKEYSWVEGSDDNFKADAGRRRGKGMRGRRRGGSGLR